MSPPDLRIAYGDPTVICCPLFAPVKPLKLSWPREGDRRRAIVGQPHPDEVIAEIAPIYSSHIIQVSDRDVAKHYQLSGTMPSKPDRPTFQPLLSVDGSIPDLEEGKLFEHFRKQASRALPIFGYDPARLGQALVRTAYADKSNAAHALFRLMMSFAAMDKHGLTSQMMDLKIEALNALAKDSGTDLWPVAATQHLAANLLLCAIELHRASCTTGQWLIYLSSAKSFVRCGNLPVTTPGTDLALLLDWLYYFDVLARFSFQHWHGSYTDNSSRSSVFDPGALRAGLPNTATPIMSLIELLGEVADATSIGLPQEVSSEERENHIGFLKILDWRIQNTSIKVAEGQIDPEAREIMELFKLAMLIYLNRANEDILGPNAKTQNRVERSFEMVSRLRYCDRQFPVFILGCEARTDKQRAVILDVMARTEAHVPSRSYAYARLLLSALWTQDDLAEGQMEYWQRLSQVLKECTNLPTFV